VTETKVRVVRTYDDETEARIEADRLYGRGKRAGVASVVDWERSHPDSPLKTANRFLVYEETHS
jgi:hypothetical protein